MTRTIYIFIALLSALLCSCGGGRSAAPDAAGLPAAAPDAAVQPRAVPELPPPAELDRILSQVDDEERFKWGGYFEPSLPKNNSSGQIFTPSWTDPSDTLALAAYACYRYSFQTGSYEGGARLRLMWDLPPSDLGNVYIGLANRNLNRWSWFQHGEDGINAGSTIPYTNASGEIVFCVLVLGTEGVAFQGILLGENTTPVVYITTNLNSDPFLNVEPCIVTLDATNSYSWGGDIVSWDFDYDADGVWDKQDDPDGIAQHQYMAGNYTARVRATEESGKQGIREIEFIIMPTFNNPPTAVVNSDLLSGSGPLEVMVDALGSSDSDGTITKYEFDIDNDGQYEVETTDPGPFPVMLGSFGANIIGLRVTDNFLGIDTASVQVTLSSGWVYSTVDPDAFVTDRVDMAVVGAGAAARAAVAYTCQEGVPLRYCAASTVTANAWAPVRNILGPTDELASSPAPALAYMQLNDIPVISYIDRDQNQDYVLNVIKAQNLSGNGWDFPVPVSQDEVIGDTDLIVLNNLVGVATMRRPGGSLHAEISYYQALNEQATSWSSPRTVAPVVLGTSYLDLALLIFENGLFDRPMLSYVAQTGDSDYSLHAVRSNNTDGTTWEAPVKLGDTYAYDTDLETVNGNPAAIAGASPEGGELVFTRSGDEKAASWPSPLQQLGSGGICSMGVWGGKPCIAYYTISGDGLMMIRASDADGSSWGPPFPVDTLYRHGSHCNMVVANEVPVVCYFDEAGQKLLAAAWKSS